MLYMISTKRQRINGQYDPCLDVSLNTPCNQKITMTAKRNSEEIETPDLATCQWHPVNLRLRLIHTVRGWTLTPGIAILESTSGSGHCTRAHTPGMSIGTITCANTILVASAYSFRSSENGFFEHCKVFEHCKEVHNYLNRVIIPRKIPFLLSKASVISMACIRASSLRLFGPPFSYSCPFSHPKTLPMSFEKHGA